MSSHLQPFIRNLLQITSQNAEVKGQVLVTPSQKAGVITGQKIYTPPTFFQTLKTYKTRQDAALPHFSPEKIAAICFLLNKGSRSLASLTPQTKNQRARAGRQMPQTQLQGWHSHHLTNPPGTAGGQRPEITIQRHREGRKGGLTGGMAHYVNHPPIGSVFLLVSCQ